MIEEFGEELVLSLKRVNPRFASILAKHKDLDTLIDDVEAGRGHLSDFELDRLKKEKLKIKDEAYSLLYKYKKELIAA